MPSRTPELTRTILALAIPALGALIAEPLFTIIDSAMIGHLGTEQLAGLAIGSQVLATVIVLFIFLAYSTTSLTAKAVGAGKTRKALRLGIDAAYLATLLGIIAAIIVAATAPIWVDLLGASAEATPHALAYIYASTPGITGMFTVMAVTGTLRGFQNTTTPLYVTSIGAVFNVAINALLIYELNWGVTGSGVGTSITQLLMAHYMVSKLANNAKAHGVNLRPRMSGVLTAVHVGAPLIIRGLGLRIAGLATIIPVAGAGSTAVAGYQVVIAVWTLSAFILDALAIAAQSLVGKAIGEGNSHSTRLLLQELTKWGALAGIVTAVVIAFAAPALPILFGTDPDMRSIATAGLLACAVGIPIAGVVFLLDGILLGAGDNVYLAKASVLQVAVLLPALWGVELLRQAGASAMSVVVWAWVAYAVVYCGARLATNWWRTWMDPKFSVFNPSSTAEKRA